jgi:oxygen-independent coproporphyrinogen-3 oxidase
MALADLLTRYNLPIPRYTSYPTVPVWQDWDEDMKLVSGQTADLPQLRWLEQLNDSFRQYNRPDGISLYIHLPYCTQLCTYCGCNKKITTNHLLEAPYVDAVLKEWSMYLQQWDSKPLIREIHLGGGTPTFFSAKQLARLIQGILLESDLHADYQFSIEGHPNYTSLEQLKTLNSLGFRRISYGVQDLDPEVQRIINRIQPFENLVETTVWARAEGFESVNFDLIYGLPKQNTSSMARTLEQLLTLRPERIAFYSYAHIPWKSKAQRLYDENDLPSPAEKMALYLMGREAFLAAGYVDIGMDHFALAHDELAIAAAENRLHRNFMGYTTTSNKLLIGLGVSSISDAYQAYGQNTRELASYLRKVNNDQWPVNKGYFLNETEIRDRARIIEMACKGSTQLEDDYVFPEAAKPWLKQLQADGLLLKNGSCIAASEKGRLFTRNLCALFDRHLHMDANVNRYSKAI